MRFFLDYMDFNVTGLVLLGKSIGNDEFYLQRQGFPVLTTWNQWTFIQ